MLETENDHLKALLDESGISYAQKDKPNGPDVIGIYPLFPDGTCRFPAFDFDNHEKGAHIWIFFD